MANKINGDDYPSGPTDWNEGKITSVDDALAFCGWAIMDQNNILDPTEGFISERDGKPAHRIIITPQDMITDILGLTKNHEMMAQASWKEELPDNGGIAIYHYTQEVAEQLQKCYLKAYEVARLNGHDLFEAIFQMQVQWLVYQADPENYGFGHIPMGMNQVSALIDDSESESDQAARRMAVMRHTLMQILHQLGAAFTNEETGETALVPHLIPEELREMVEDIFGGLVHEEQVMSAPVDADPETIRNMVAEAMSERVIMDDGSHFTDEDIDSYDDDPFGAELWEEE